MNGFKNDYSAFETNKKSYNKTMKRKIEYLQNKIFEIEENFQVILKDDCFKLRAAEIEGIFVINTPTFIMYNNQYRIYTLKSFEELITGKFKDKTFTIMDIDNDEVVRFEYPYFRKPEYVVFENDEEDE